MNTEELGRRVREAFPKGSPAFRPHAVFDERLDCIRIVARDCSIVETRVNQYVTILEDNYYPTSDGSKYVGLTIKGARHFCEQTGLHLGTPIKVSQLLDAMIRLFRDPLLEHFIESVARHWLHDKEAVIVDPGSPAAPQLT